MNEVIKNIETRRSVRSYKNDPVSKEIIESICKAGTFAPSAQNKQPSIILAITNKDMVDRLERINAKYTNNPDGHPFYGAPVVLVVLANKDHPNYIYDGTCVMENLLLASASYGLGSCWIHRARQTFGDEEGKKILKELNIEGNYEGIGNVILGYPNTEILAAKPRKEPYIYYVD